jgi:alpha-1,2-mannosyltransferase
MRTRVDAVGTGYSVKDFGGRSICKDLPGRQQGSLRGQAAVLVRACLAIPAVMVGVGVILAAAQAVYAHTGQPSVPWSYTFFDSNFHAAYHALQLGGTDSWDPMWRARLWLAANPGKDVYNALFFGLGIKFQYPVSSLLFLEWLPASASDPVRILNAVNLGVFIVLIVGMILLTLTLADRAQSAGTRIDRRTRFLLGLLAAIATACFYPVLWAVGEGQIQLLLDTAFVFACWFYIRGGCTTAGVLMGLSTLIKPQMALFLVWGLLRRDLRFTVGWGVPVVVGLVLSLAVYGSTWPGGYLTVLSFISLHGESYYLNQSMNGLMSRLLENGTNLDWHPGWAQQTIPPSGPITVSTAVRWPQLHWQGSPFAPYHPLVYAASAAATAMFTLTGLACGFRRFTVGKSAGAIVLAGICFAAASPVAWTHHYGVLLPAFALCLVSLLYGRPENNRRRRAGWIMLTAAYLAAANLLSMVNWFTPGAFSLLQSYVFVAAIATLCLTWKLCNDERL